jgi:hypothetical protein
MRLPPTRTAPPRVQERARPKEPTARVAERPPAPPVDTARSRTKKKPSLEMGDPVVTAGAGGEQNITVDMFWVEVEANLPAGFTVTTRPTHELEVVMEQRAYRKTYKGAGSVRTDLTPVAPIGTKGSLLARDLTTGETLEHPWTWQPRGSTSLWQIIKKLVWKGD